MVVNSATYCFPRDHSIHPPVLMLNDVPLKRVSSYKYLGVLITSDSMWSSHISNICNKTRRLVGLMYRKFYKHSSSETLLKLYSYICHQTPPGICMHCLEPLSKEGHSCPWRCAEICTQNVHKIMGPGLSVFTNYIQLAISGVQTTSSKTLPSF